MKEQPEARAVILGEYIVRQKATVRAAAEWFGVSKSTVHKDVSERLEQIQPDLIYTGQGNSGAKQTGTPYPRRSCHQAKVRPAAAA